ncbi:cytidine deaminase [Streptomyces collinus]|uniref:cytidine deaminase n=1 Tax=Streptomyces collinus TaxID=42684 RepID=UPI0036A8F56D
MCACAPAPPGGSVVRHPAKAEKTTPPNQQVDQELVAAAAEVARTRCRGDSHTMAAAVRARDDRIVTAVNVYHFTGGPCAELVAIGAAAAQGACELDTIVAVGDRDRGVVPPCGRCRRVLLDHFPALGVIVGQGKDLRAVPIADLLPESYVWADQFDGGGGPRDRAATAHRRPCHQSGNSG